MKVIQKSVPHLNAFKIAIAFVFALMCSTTHLSAQDTSKTLAYHLATNAVGHAKGFTGDYYDKVEILGPPGTNWTIKERLLKVVWSTNFWLHGVHGLSATPIGFTNLLGGQGLPTMISPRHYVVSAHMHPEGYLMAFLDASNVVHWARTKERIYTGSNDTSVGILTEDLPPSIGFLPVIPPDYADYLPTNNTGTTNYFQGVGMNQNFQLFSQPMQFYEPSLIHWDHMAVIPNGLGTNWGVKIVAGDSSDPEMLLIGEQLVLISHNLGMGGGPNYALQINDINRSMHYLSTNNHVKTDYQLTFFSFTNFSKIHH